MKQLKVANHTKLPQQNAFPGSFYAALPTVPTVLHCCMVLWFWSLKPLISSDTKCSMLKSEAIRRTFCDFGAATEALSCVDHNANFGRPFSIAWCICFAKDCNLAPATSQHRQCQPVSAVQLSLSSLVSVLSWVENACDASQVVQLLKWTAAICCWKPQNRA